LYTPVLGQSPLLDEMMEKLQSRIDRELRFQQDLMKLRGALYMTFAQVGSFFTIGQPKGEDLINQSALSQVDQQA
jgi:U3 small nucleolar RNA-associated protein 15